MSALALLGFAFWSIAGEAVREGGLTDAALDDYAIARHLGGEVVRRAGYAWQLEASGPAVVFAYSPTYALLHAALGRAGVVGPALWLAALLAACWAAARAVLALAGARRMPLRWLGLLLGVFACRAFVQSDLHFLNSNVLAAALALQAAVVIGVARAAPRREALRGLLLAASLAVKPWAVALLPALALARRGSALVWCAAGIAVVFGGVPALAVGVPDAWSLHREWLGVLASIGGERAHERMSVYNVSLTVAAAALGGSDGFSRLAVRVMQGAWLAVTGALVWRALRAGPARRDWLRLVATLLVAPLPLTPILQPHHVALAAPLAMGVGLEVVAPQTSARRRAGLLAALVLVFALASYPRSGPAEAFAVFGCLAVLLAAAWWPGRGTWPVAGADDPAGTG